MMITSDPSGSINEDDFLDKEDLEDIDEQTQDETQEVANEENFEKTNEEITIENLYLPTFDMQATIAAIFDMPEQIKSVIGEIDNNNISPTLGDIDAFESICMDIIEKIVRLNKDWTRQEAIQEAAKELVAVRNASQSLMAETVHMRVLKEFQIATDKEYLLLWKQLWDE